MAKVVRCYLKPGPRRPFMLTCAASAACLSEASLAIRSPRCLNVLSARCWISLSVSEIILASEPGVHVAAIHDCRAGNVEVTIHTLEDKPLGRGWIIPGATSGGSPPAKICSAQLTTCS